MQLTIFYEPNRFDKAPENNAPFSGVPGGFFKEKTFDTYPDLILDIRYPEYFHLPLPKETTHVLGLGNTACQWITQESDLNKHRGYRKLFHGRPCIVTYAPIDCWEFRVSEDEDEENASDTSEKDVAKTRRSNYLFWAIADIKKLFRQSRPHAKKLVQIGPNLDEVTSLLLRAPKNTTFVIDIETRIQDKSLDIIGLGILTKDTTYVYVIPIYNWNNTRFYPSKQLGRFFKALDTALARPDLLWVGQNIFFDLSVLHHFYHLSIPPHIHDTMLYMHRHYPTIDKSLSHAISFYTDAAQNHKGNFCPNISREFFNQLCTYNGDDVYWTGEVYRRQDELTETASESDPVIPSRACLNVAFDAARVCAIMAFTGITVDENALAIRKLELEAELHTLSRIGRILTGVKDFNLNSTQQAADWFYGMLDYEILEVTDSGRPAADEKTLYKLQLRQPNPLIPVIIAYRSRQKELSGLNFIPYENHNPAGKG